MPDMESFSETQRRRHELERLLEAISIGTVAEVGDLDPDQEALLREAYPNDDDLQKVFDRIRGEDPDET